jgi:hypothetical protein
MAIIQDGFKNVCDAPGDAAGAVAMEIWNPQAKLANAGLRGFFTK